MKPTSDTYRIARLCLALNVLPFVRYCDDQRGLTETSGLVWPYITHSNHHWFREPIDWPALAFNVLILTLLILVLRRFHPAVSARLLSLRIFLIVSAVIFVSPVLSLLTFFLMVLMMMPASSLFIGIQGAWLFDVASRIVIVAPMLFLLLRKLPPPSWQESTVTPSETRQEDSHRPTPADTAQIPEKLP